MKDAAIMLIELHKVSQTLSLVRGLSLQTGNEAGYGIVRVRLQIR